MLKQISEEDLPKPLSHDQDKEILALLDVPDSAIGFSRIPETRELPPEPSSGLLKDHGADSSRSRRRENFQAGLITPRNWSYRSRSIHGRPSAVADDDTWLGRTTARCKAACMVRRINKPTTSRDGVKPEAETLLALKVAASLFLYDSVFPGCSTAPPLII
jgi:hypothetical protein